MRRELVALRVPPGWAVTGNDFVEWSIDDPEDRAAAESFLSEDLLRIVRLDRVEDGWAAADDGTVVDLGWIGSGEPGGLLDGEYLLTVVRGEWDGDEVVELRHRDWRVMRDAVDLALRTVRSGRSPLLLAADFGRLAGRG